MLLPGSRIKEAYCRLFSVHEFENSPALKATFFVLLFHFITALKAWAPLRIGTKQARSGAVCWPHFPDCQALYFLNDGHHGNSYNFFISLLFVCIVFAAVRAYQGRWFQAHIALLILTLWRFTFFFVMTMNIPAAYEYFTIPFALIAVFSSSKLLMMRVALVLLYFLSAQVKFHDSWVLGTYFTSTKSSVPLISSDFVPFFTNLVIIWEIFGSWLLLFTRWKHHRVILVLWLLFHWYSCFVVGGLIYPSYVVPILISLFGIRESASRKKHFFGDSVTALIGGFFFLLHLVPHLNYGDIKWTLEGYKYGVGMIDANHQCQSDVTYVFKSKKNETSSYRSSEGQSRCWTYAHWYRLHRRCETEADIERIEWKLFHSINGLPFYKIVDTKNVCNLNYSVMTHNDWVKIPGEGAEISGYPRKNFLYGKGGSRTDRIIFDEPSSEKLSTVQGVISRYKDIAIKIYWTLWFGSGLLFFRKYLYT